MRGRPRSGHRDEAFSFVHRRACIGSTGDGAIDSGGCGQGCSSRPPLPDLPLPMGRGV